MTSATIALAKPWKEVMMQILLMIQIRVPTSLMDRQSWRCPREHCPYYHWANTLLDGSTNLMLLYSACFWRYRQCLTTQWMISLLTATGSSAMCLTKAGTQTKTKVLSCHEGTCKVNRFQLLTLLTVKLTWAVSKVMSICLSVWHKHLTGVGFVCALCRGRIRDWQSTLGGRCCSCSWHCCWFGKLCCSFWRCLHGARVQLLVLGALAC